MLETAITRQIQSWLRKQPRVYFFKVWGNSRMRAGLPDIVCSVGGMTLFLEVKTTTGALSPRQVVEHERIRQAGSRVAVVRSLAEARAQVLSLLPTCAIVDRESFMRP